MTRESFDKELGLLNEDLLKMALLTKEQMHNAVVALVEQDGELAEKVKEQDDVIDNLQQEIEDKCIKLIAKEQPLAIDLRTIFSTAKITQDLERMADHAVDIARIVIRLKDEKYIKPLVDIPKISKIVEKMISSSIAAFIDKDIVESYKICKMDDEIDELYRSIFSQLLYLMSKDMSITNQASQLLFVIKYLERVADHATNICEGTIYLVTGEYESLNR
ncbi:MAG: phosphate signaling complex protein PhoU [Clostridiaceae bacterium]